MNTATIIHVSADYRVVAVGHTTKGYEDSYVVEKREADAIGGDRWTEVSRWAVKQYGDNFQDDRTKSVLVEMIKSLKVPS